jgi:hypothetical protein
LFEFNQGGKTMKRVLMIAVLFSGMVLVAVLSNVQQGRAQNSGGDESRIQQGFQSAPQVHLDLHGKNRALVGLGSYLVNAVGGCNDCHTCPSYTPGHSPFAGEDGQINATNYLAGGVHFGPFVSRNLTPDGSGKPAGLTFEQFLHVIRTGEDPEDPGELLQVMPWPVFRNMTDHDLMAIYEFLRSIPHAEPGSCAGAGQ